MNFTQEQHAAITTTDKNLIVLAGAGSGKTRVLVERYIHLLEINPTWRIGNLVAITFTRKAADEMRDRVRRTLEVRAAQNAQSRWSDLLGEIDSARIDTIHGLCTAILRANAAHAGIDPDFEVLDEFDSRVLLEETVRDVLTRLARQDAPEMALFREYEDRQVFEALTDVQLLQSVRDDVPDDLLEHWSAQWTAVIEGEVRRFLSVVNQNGTFEDAGDNLGALWAAFVEDCTALDTCDDAETALELLERVGGINFRPVRKSKKTPEYWGDVETFEDAKNTLMTYRELARQALATIGAPPDDLDQRAAALLPLWINLLRAVRDAYHDARMRRGALNFDDLEEKTVDLLTRYPEVCQRYRNREFTHLLVDEFQDTNSLQWRIVKSLADLNHAGSLFVVGDQKQSIYGFRGADVSVFGDVQREITETQGAALNLSMSFRTHHPLVDCFNTLFDHLLRRDDASPVRDFQVERGMAMSAFRTDPPDAVPHVEFILIDHNHRDEHGDKVKDAKNKAQTYSAEERRQWEAYEIASRIHTLMDGGRLVFDKEENITRPLRYDDVAILFRSMSHVTLYEAVFKAVGLPYETIAGQGYYARQEIWDILNLLRALHNPSDDLSLAAALRSPLFGLSDDALLALRLQTDEDGETLSLWKALHDPGDLFPADEIEHLTYARGCLRQLREFSGRMLISELIEEVLDRTGYLAVLTGLPDGVRRRRNVEKLLEKARDGRHVTLSDFTQYLHDLTDYEVREGEAALETSGAVRLMTVHASKGLEFPVVVLADASWERGGGNRAMVMTDPVAGIACKVYDEVEDKVIDTFSTRYAAHLANLRDEAERLRLLYVAMTRAQDYVILSGSANETSKDGWKLKGWLGQVVDVLGLQEHLAPGISSVFDYAWGQVRVTLPLHFPTQLAGGLIEDQHLLENMPLAHEIPPEKPFLLNSVPVRPEAMARHLAATQIADLGSLEAAETEQDQQFYRERFRKQLLNDAPTPIDLVSDAPDRVNDGQMGEIVREALRHWQIPQGGADTDLKAMLYSFAWRYHITDEVRAREATHKAYNLLRDFQRSEVCQMIENAATVYRELPFIYEHDNVILHGVIDVLLQTADGGWVIVDYKTSHVNEDDTTTIEDHARRYTLQLAIYARAAQEQLNGIMPETWIHYIRYNQSVPVPEAARRDALSRSLTERIVDVIKQESL